MKRYILAIIIIFLTNHSFALEEELSEEQILFIESFSDNEERNYDYEELADELLSLQRDPINLNSCQLAELTRLPGIDESIAMSIIQHREKYGRFLTLYELKNIPTLTPEQIIHLLPYLTIAENEENISLRKSLADHKQQVILRTDRIVEKKKGYEQKKYEGDPFHYYLKYQFTAADKVSFGLTGEKDAGEKGWKKEHLGFDFHSFHLQLSNWKHIQTLCVGDYKVNFGQGLVMGSGFIIGKSNNVLNTFQRRRGVYKYTSTAEADFLRGVGGTFRIKRTEFSLIASHKKTDATLNESDQITSFKTDGLHRTENELEKERNSAETIIGTNICHHTTHLSVGGTFLYYRYNHILSPAPKAYNLYKTQGENSHWNASVDYSLRFLKMNMFGETAIDRNRGIATFNAIKIHPASRIGLLWMQRYYQPQYQAQFGNAFGENSRVENEKGYYIGCEFLPFRKIKLSLYMDSYQFPWLKYGINHPSSGYEWMGHLAFHATRNCDMQLKYKYKKKTNEKHTVRYSVRHDIGRITLQTLWEGNLTPNYGKATTHGWAAAEEVLYKFNKRLSLYGRYAYFHAPNYANCLYIYERDALYTFSIPMHYGIGHRLAFYLQYQPTPSLSVYLKGNTTLYTDGREKCGSGNEEIKGNRVTGLNLVGRWAIHKKRRRTPDQTYQ